VSRDDSFAAVGEETPPQKPSVSEEETAGIGIEKGQEIVVKEAELPVIVESSPHALAAVKTSSREPSPGISEVSQKEVTNIVKTFSDEDLYEENELTETQVDSPPEPPGVTEGVYPDVGQTDEEAVDEPEEDRMTEIPDESGSPVPPVFFSFNRKQWFDLLKWAHHSTKLSHEQRLQIVRMGRLIQKDRKLTRKQEEQVKEMIALVQALGYRPS